MLDSLLCCPSRFISFAPVALALIPGSRALSLLKSPIRTSVPYGDEYWFPVLDLRSRLSDSNERSDWLTRERSSLNLMNRAYVGRLAAREPTAGSTIVQLDLEVERKIKLCTVVLNQMVDSLDGASSHGLLAVAPSNGGKGPG